MNGQPKRSLAQRIGSDAPYRQHQHQHQHQTPSVGQGGSLGRPADIVWVAVHKENGPDQEAQRDEVGAEEGCQVERAQQAGRGPVLAQDLGRLTERDAIACMASVKLIAYPCRAGTAGRQGSVSIG